MELKVKKARAKCYIAAPLFNYVQIDIIKGIEDRLTRTDYDFYSPRLHSGSDKLSPEDRQRTDAWDDIFHSNIDGLVSCDFMIAVLDYALPDQQQLGIIDPTKRALEAGGPPSKGKKVLVEFVTPVAMADNGVVWEMGMFYLMKKPIYGFCFKNPTKLNLMLSHGVDGVIIGNDKLREFLAGDWRSAVERYSGEVQ